MLAARFTSIDYVTRRWGILGHEKHPFSREFCRPPIRTIEIILNPIIDHKSVGWK